MTPDSVGPLSRPFPLGRVTEAGTDVSVEADPAERAALAADLGLAAIHGLVARFRVTGEADRVRVTGRVRASVEQICVVTLEPFQASVDEEVEMAFAVPDPRRSREPGAEIEIGPEDDPPDELTGDRIDLGSIAAEFLALGLDPYPRKPGVSFEQPAAAGGDDGPFAGLAALRPSDREP